MSNLVTKALLGRKNVFQAVVLASLIALGVNLLAAWASDCCGKQIWIKWVIGLLLVVLGLVLFIGFLLREKTVDKHMEGVFILNQSKKDLVGIDDYDLSVRLQSALRGAFLENKALRSSWEAEPIFRKREKNGRKATETPTDTTESKAGPKKISFVAIVRMEMKPEDRPHSEKSVLLEAIEFCMLEFLSNHLSEYFDSFDDKDRQVCTLTRADIPHILLENRVLSLLSTPIEDRQIFVESGISKEPPPEGEVHVIRASNGAVYERFDLKLPTGTKVLRPTQGSIRLEHCRFTLDIESAFHGFSENLPVFFESCYLGEDQKELDPRKVQFRIRAQLHSSAFLRLKGWEYYRWLDSFIEYFEKQVSFDAFLGRIQWAATSSHIRARRIMERVGRKKGNEPHASCAAREPTAVPGKMSEGHQPESSPQSGLS